jgi:cell division protein FtsW (lipid II flippase)
MKDRNEYESELENGETAEKKADASDKKAKEKRARGKELKTKLEKKLEVYLERRREKLIQNDVVFTESLTPEEKQTPVLARGGIDNWFLICVMLLLMFGAVMSFSASSVYASNKYGDSAYFFKRYILYSLLSIIVSIPFVIFMTPRYWKAAGAVIYAGTVLLLMVVLVIGSARGGAQRWIEIGPITIQPSEIAKMAVVMVLALYMSKHEKEVTSLHQFGGSFKHGVLIPGCIIGVIIVLVALEKHISGIIIIGMIGI